MTAPPFRSVVTHGASAIAMLAVVAAAVSIAGGAPSRDRLQASARTRGIGVDGTTVSPTSPVAPAAVDGRVLVADLLGLVVVEDEHDGGYDSALFGYGIDQDGDGCDTRAEVLMAESRTLPQVAFPACSVTAGDWYSLYDGVTYTSPVDVEIDHVVPLKEAWDSGAWRWSPATLVAFGNDVEDPRTLRAVASATNSAKGDRDPATWLPTNGVGICEYLADWVAVKVRWSLTMDRSEFGRITNLMRGPCAGTTTAAFLPVVVAP